MDSDVPAVIASVSGTLSRTETITAEQAAEPVAPPVLRLALHRPPPDRKVSWGEDTVDNEHMGKKKSKCCCIYHKPRKFDESSSSSDDECEHCFGHVERRKKNTESVTTPQEPPNDANLLCEVPIKTPPIDDQTPCEENPHPIENRSDQ